MAVLVSPISQFVQPITDYETSTSLIVVENLPLLTEIIQNPNYTDTESLLCNMKNEHG